MQADRLHKTILRTRSREIVVVFCVLVTAVASYRLFDQSRALFVVVSNQTGHTITNVSIHFRGGPVSVGTIEDKDQETTRIFVANDTGIGIQYTELGNNVTIEEFGYVERGFRGEMQFTLKPNGTHDIHDAVKPFI